jgi:hypothetical protein
MTDRDRQRQIDLLAIQFAQALEADDFETVDRLWTIASTDPDLETVFVDAASELVQLYEADTRARLDEVVTEAAEKHLVSGRIIRPTGAAITVADVANDLFHRPQGGLPAAAHQVNERLRMSSDLLPADLALSKLTAWAEARFGPAPANYWKAFRQAALKLELRRAAEAEYHLAARPAPKPEDQP